MLISKTQSSKAKVIALLISILLMIVAAYVSYRYVVSSKLYNQAIELHESGNIKEAKLAYKRVIKLNPWHADATYQLGVIMRDEGRLSEALKLVSRSIDLNNQEPDYFVGIGFLYLNYFNNTKKAKEQFAKAYSLDNRSYYACFMLGDLAEREKNLTKAEFYYTKAIKADPGLTIAYRKLARLYEASGDEGKARSYWQSVLKINPQDKDAKYYLKSFR